MFDPQDWVEHDRALQEIMDAHRATAYPPGVLEAYIAGQRRKHALMQADIMATLQPQSATPPASRSGR